MKRFQAVLVPVLAVVVSVGLLSSAAVASSMIQIHFEGLKFHYSDPGVGLNGAIYDADNAPVNDNTIRGAGNVSAFATPMTAVSIFQDQVPVGTVPNAYADMYVGGIPDIAATSSATYGTTASGFGFDLISSSDGISGTNVLQLDLSSFSVSYLSFGVVSIVAGGGTVNPIVSQSLPGGLIIDGSKPVTISLTSAALSKVQLSPDGTRVMSFDAFGTGDVNATLVPEPATLVSLAGMAVVGLACGLLRRRRQTA